MLSYVGITEARDRGGVREPPGDSGSTRLARGRPGVGAHLAGAGPGVDPHCPGRGSTHFLLPQTVVFIGIEIDIDRSRFAPSFFATSRVTYPSILRLFFAIVFLCPPPLEK